MNKGQEEKNMPFKVNMSDRDIVDAMRDIPGYIDITPGDFKELYRVAYHHAMSRIAASVMLVVALLINYIPRTRRYPGFWM